MTYAELLTLIQDYCQNTADEFVAALPDIVRLAEDRIYQSVQIPALKKNATAVLVNGVRLVPLPADFLAAYSLATRGSSGVYSNLLERDVSYITEAFPDPSAVGTPRFYALYDAETLMLGPAPFGGLLMDFYYFYEPESIVTASTSWLGDNAESVLFYGALCEAYVYMKGEADLIALYRARYDEALARLKALGEGMNKRDSFRIDAPKIAP